MNNITNIQHNAGTAAHAAKAWFNAEPLIETDKPEALAFLSKRPFDAVMLAGLIHDHGIESTQHRGKFFGCRDQRGQLVGVALIGKVLLFEADSDESIGSFARCASECSDVRVVFAEEEKLRTFWRTFKPEAEMPEPTRHIWIKSFTPLSDLAEPMKGLRAATINDLDPIVSVHAAMVHAETGVDPLLTDADGFRNRCAERVKAGRVWVCFKNGELIFKTDIATETPDALYAEGLWVHPDERRKGIATQGLATIRRLWTSTSGKVICAFMSSKAPPPESFFAKAGFAAVSEYARVYI